MVQYSNFNLKDRHHGISKIKYLAGRTALIGIRSMPGRILKAQSFSFAGQEYKYCIHRYNDTWATERTVEIPIVWRTVAGTARGSRILEVGNVLSHYYPISHEVIDKYEKSGFAQNIDIIDFKPDSQFDLIVSISTLEHVGWDETPREPEKGLQAIDHLRSLLKPGGTLLATIPLGHNEFLDEQIKKGPIFANERFLRRTSEFNSWQEVGRSALEDAHYNHPFPGANVVLVGFSTQ